MILSLLLALQIFIVVCMTTASASSAPEPTVKNSTESCPIDFGYVSRVPWPISDCKEVPNTSQSTNRSQCCQTLLSLFGIGIAQHLKRTSFFQLPNLPISVSCISDFQSRLSSLTLPHDLTSSCMDPGQFILKPNICASIQSTKDWRAKLGSSTALDTACKPDLTQLTACDACVAAGLRVQADLVAVDGNRSHTTECFYFTVLYAAGVVNKFGPESKGTAACIFGLSVEKDSKGKSRVPLILGLAGGWAAVLIIALPLGLYFWFERKKRIEMA